MNQRDFSETPGLSKVVVVREKRVVIGYQSQDLHPLLLYWDSNFL